MAVSKGDNSKNCFRKTLGPPNLGHFGVLTMHLFLSFTRSVEAKMIDFKQALRFCDMYAIQRVKSRLSERDP